MEKGFRFHPFKCINGCKGAISLFLAVLMTPFLTIAMMLVEVGRFNSSVSILDEAMGVSATSTLANFDEYLQKRWGLLGVSQDVDINKLYGDYLTINGGIMGNSLTMNDSTATGIYPLSESEILYNQVMEYSKFNAPTKLATSFFDLAGMIRKLEKIGNMKNFFEIISSSADGLDSAITFAETAEELKGIAEKLEGRIKEFDSGYNALKRAVDRLTSALKEKRPSDKDEADAYDDHIEYLRELVDDSVTAYRKTIPDIISLLTTYKEKMDGCMDAIENIRKNIASVAANTSEVNKKLKEQNDKLEETNKKIGSLEKDGFSESDTQYLKLLKTREALENNVLELAVHAEMDKATEQGYSTVTEGWKKSISTYNGQNLDRMVSALKSLDVELAKLRGSSISKNYTLNKNTYHITVAGFISSADLGAYLRDQAALYQGSFTSVVKGIMSFIKSLFQLSAVYNPKLCSNIDTNYYEGMGGLPGNDSSENDIMKLASRMGDMMSEFEKSYLPKNGILSIIFLSFKGMIQNTMLLVSDLVEFAKTIISNISELMTGYDRIYYTAYSAFNLPCRTDYIKEKPTFRTMTGYSFTKSTLPNHGELYEAPIIGSLAALFKQIIAFTGGSGDDLAFSGAELEYVLFGSNSEMANQTYTFLSIYIVRLLLNLPMILTNTEVQVMAEASMLGYPIVMLVEVLAEPLIDTLLLVNGSSEPLIKTSIYLTPTGLPKMLSKLWGVLKNITTAQKEKIESGLIGVFQASDDDYNYQKKLAEYQKEADNEASSSSSENEEDGRKEKHSDPFKLDYREHCYVLMLLLISRSQQMERLSNLIQMESTYHYSKPGACHDTVHAFDLRKSYTYIQAQADVSVRQMLPSLADSSLFTVQREQFRGY
ncbi:DUF5702 domain-containing protein [Candidatus Soleaferrea massiliensis]|uniref:DUF5702 domain-containing protein n=1 Tax=Candidatus Soleaferrea massiliensis TaxID=1470354 RepID=UPI00059144C5|nr:DUF5702 domain-containing protein [Candidatus Soleaferrea massiliensis]